MDRPSVEMPDGSVGATRGVGRRSRRSGRGLAFLLIPLSMGGPARAGEPPRSPKGQLKLGEELFNREWTPNDPRCHGGDGLGPVYNATSCVDCHGLGGPGGAGPSGMNVQLISAVGDEITGEFGFRSNQISVGNRSDPRVPDLRPISERADLVFGIAYLHLSTGRAGGRFRNGLVFSANGTTLKSHEFELRLNL